MVAAFAKTATLSVNKHGSMKTLFPLSITLLLLTGSLSSRAQLVSISQDGANVVFTWEGEGVLQFAVDVVGPWMDESTSSPHSVPILGDQMFFRIFYPNGFQPVFEPPGLAFAEPNALSSRVASSMSRGWLVPEIGDEVLVHSGETRRTEVDLCIKGRGMDFIWARCYRSRHGPDSEQGNRWVFSYDVRIQPVGAHVRVFDGSGRSDVFLQQSDGSYAADQFFREGRFDSNGVFRLTFADTGFWEFIPLDGQPAFGKIARIVDRNSNELTFGYDALGRLIDVTDTLNRHIQVAYNANGFIESVTDFTGREVRYDYYQDPEVGGSFGDLKSARSPIVVGTPTLNDFPGGKTNRYTYSEGFREDRENHLLLSITDPKGQNSREYVYQHNQSNFDFLRCRTMRLGDLTNLIQFEYVELVPSPSNQFAVQKVVVNDRMGNVSEQFLDQGNRLVRLREFTGRADPSQSTTDILNRPTNPLRTNDPPFFETAWEWNSDSLLARVVYPNGNSISNVYESSINPSAKPLSRANLREQYEFPGAFPADQPALLRSWTYDSRFGTQGRYDPSRPASRGFGFVTMVDARGNTTSLSYDGRGNCTNVVHRIRSIVEDFQYNAFGQLFSHVLPDNGAGHRRTDLYLYHTGGPQTGYLQQRIRDFGSGGVAQTTTYAHDSVGNLLSITDPRGNDSLFTYNALDQHVHSESRETSIPGGAAFRQTVDYFYDANDNLVRMCESNADELGRMDPGNAYITQLMEYDILDQVVRVCAESGIHDVPRNPPKLDCSGLPSADFVTTEYEYDANWNRTLVRLGEASEGRDTNNTVRSHYDERDLPYQQVRAEGSALQSTTQFDYDGNGNLSTRVSGLEMAPRMASFAYDGYDRLLSAVDAMGNVAMWHYDANGNAVSNRVDGELLDLPGSVANSRLTESTLEYDPMNRLTRKDVAFFQSTTGVPIDDGLATTWFTYSDSSQLLTRTDDNGHTTGYGYDRLHRLSRGRDARSNDVFYTYDANSNPIEISSLEKSDLGNPDQTFATSFQYDKRDRLTGVFDNISNSVQYAYDSRGNLVLTTDQLGVQTRQLYDGLSRQISVVQDMNANGPNPSDPADIVVSNVWDDSFRLVARMDDNSNATTYAYDALNRMVQETLADGTGTTNSYDVHDNLVTRRDANGNAMGSVYDLLDRMTTRTIVPGPGVSTNTTFESFHYDGLSRLVDAEDDDSIVQFQYNSLGGVLSQQLNGETTTSSFDGVGNTLQCIYPGGRAVGYSYDALDRIKAILNSSNIVQCTYDFIGPDRMERMDYANGTRTDYFYDGITGVPNPSGDFGVKRRIRTLHTLPATGAVIDDRSNFWDARSSKIARIDQRGGGSGLRYDYEYDGANRMNKAELIDSLVTVLRDTRYALDGVGNRLAVTNNSVVQIYTLDPTVPVPADFQVNQYTAEPLGIRTYDGNGNLQALNSGQPFELLFEFDYADRLVRLSDPGNSITNEYTYDALGRRVEMTILRASQPLEVTRYFYGADWSSHANALQVVEEQDGFGATLATFVYGGGVDDVLHMQRGGNDYHFHHDELGNVMAATDGAGAVVERYDYGDFGEPMFFSGSGTSRPDSAIGNPYLFTGRRHDDETGLYYYRNRYLDPYAGRFITRDPLGTWGDPGNSGNGLAYVGNNPWTHTDPMGLAKEKFVRDKPHVNIGTIGHSTQASASKKAKEIVVVGSKLRSKKLFVGGLSWDTSEARSDKRKQSLYFPETMLAEIKEEAVGHAHGHLDYIKKIGDPATGPVNKITVHGWDPRMKVRPLQDRILIKRAAQQTPGAHVPPSQVKVLLMGFSPSASSVEDHPDFMWQPRVNPADEFGRVKVKFPWTSSATGDTTTVDARGYALWRGGMTTLRAPHTGTGASSGREDSIMVIGWNHEVVSPRDASPLP